VLWWIWALLGLALLGLEVLTPGGFYVLFFGVGAVVVGALVALGYGGPTWAQWLLFSVISIVTLALFRQRVLRLVDDRRPAPAIDTLHGEVALLLEDLAPGAIGKVELRGTVWTAQNVDDRLLAHGQRARVSRVDGLTLKLRAE
jgi:membrane protein implicated in regulation of membrane protease activity